MVHVPRDVVDTLQAGPTPVEDIDDGSIRALRASGATIDVADGAYVLTDLGYGGSLAVGIDSPYRVEYFDSVESTNTIARTRAEAGATDLVVLAAVQTGGAGRRDRVWHSPRGGVWLSIVTHPTIPADKLGLLTFAAAIAVVDAAAKAGVETRIKWPNDVLDADGKKLAGVLTESGFTDAGNRFSVVGIGVNADIDPSALPSTATSLSHHAAGVDPAMVAIDVVSTFEALRGDPVAILDRWREDAATLGQPVAVTTDDGTIAGTAVDVTDTGALLVDSGTRRHTVTAGDCEHLSRLPDE